ncbi:MAG: ABC transporter ATP-binding protein [Planctomycetes bacterium]|nr:ABC transporter ATP-binding protein [Planctomycetota bacterium]
MTNALEVRGITKRFGRLTAVDDVSFTVLPGQIMGFIGPNGAGKTTTMRICSTLEMPDRGDVLVDGQSVIEEPRLARQRIGFMPDSYGAYANTTIVDYLDFFARAYGVRGERRRATLERVIEFTSLGDLREKEIDALSKGMKQRLCLAKTLLHDPAVMILDEPAAGLDPRARVELRELVKALAQMGKAILVSSHILTELSEMCTSVTVIERGKVRGTGSVADVVRSVKPRTRIYVRVLCELELAERTLLERPRVTDARREREGLTFDFEGTNEELAALLEQLVAEKLGLFEFTPEALNLEDIFLTLTEGKLQ